MKSNCGAPACALSGAIAALGIRGLPRPTELWLLASPGPEISLTVPVELAWETSLTAVTAKAS
jgi:hypothetical protein